MIIRKYNYDMLICYEHFSVIHGFYNWNNVFIDHRYKNNKKGFGLIDSNILHYNNTDSSVKTMFFIRFWFFTGVFINRLSNFIRKISKKLVSLLKPY